MPITRFPIPTSSLAQAAGDIVAVLDAYLQSPDWRTVVSADLDGITSQLNAIRADVATLSSAVASQQAEIDQINATPDLSSVLNQALA